MSYSIIQKVWTSFSCLTPADDSDVELFSFIDIANQNIVTSPVNILLVEDSTLDARLAQRSLNHLNFQYNLNILNKGVDVLPYLHNQKHARPDVMLLDLGLPDMSGLEILETIAGEDAPLRNIPVIVLTGYAGFEPMRKKEWPAIIDFISKPCRISDMCEAVENALLL